MKKKCLKIIRRLISIQKEILIAFIIALFSILIIEVWLKDIESPTKLIFTIGNIFLTICYSILASSVFFFINQHLPKEDKIIKANRYVTNRMIHIHYEIQYLQHNLKLKIRFKLEDLKNEIYNCCKEINPNTEIHNIDEFIHSFDNWYNYLEFKMNKLIGLLDDILPFYEGMNSDLFETLLNLKDSIRQIQYDLENSPRNSNNLTFFSTHIENLIESQLKANKIIRIKYKQYLDESIENQKNENQKRENEKNDINKYKNSKKKYNIKKYRL
ncbi:hypothetical protein FNW25_15055 [Flavobacterium franklandianum]|uniref:hypothetical protein n=1 Tax=Flavobacterium franklandianum TaxID=2594430 RepID=UPI00117A43B9|nr:hypothetical protein [Flavobacterium franklandianum]TRX22326.1 hypothetical protein FNW25_15055 [Flavobacterium franklandianum]